MRHYINGKGWVEKQNDRLSFDKYMGPMFINIKDPRVKFLYEEDVDEEDYQGKAIHYGIPVNMYRKNASFFSKANTVDTYNDTWYNMDDPGVQYEGLRQDEEFGDVIEISVYETAIKLDRPVETTTLSQSELVGMKKMMPVTCDNCGFDFLIPADVTLFDASPEEKEVDFYQRPSGYDRCVHCGAIISHVKRGPYAKYFDGEMTVEDPYTGNESIIPVKPK